MTKSLIIFLATAFLCCFSSFAALADEEGLYPAAPPPGSAFIRFVNADSSTPMTVKMRGKSYGAVAFGNVSSYAPVPQGETDVSLGPVSSSTNLKEGAYYTALLVKGNMSILEEPANDSKLKAQIILINASSTPDISLKTADGSTGIINSVDTSKLGGRSVNAVNALFSVYATTTKINDLGAHLLERGERYAVIVYDGTNGKPAVTFY